MTSPARTTSTEVEVLDSSVSTPIRTSTPTPAGPSESALVAAASRGDLNLAAEVLDTNPGDLLADLLRDPYTGQALQISTELLRTRLMHELADRLLDSIDTMTPDAAGRLLSKLMELQKSALAQNPSSGASPPPSPVQPVNILNFNGAGASEEGLQSARDKLAERLAAGSVPERTV